VKGTYVPTREAIRRALASDSKPNLVRSCSLAHPLRHATMLITSEQTIINTSSSVSTMTTPGRSAYSPSKSAVNRLTEFVHFEYEAEGIRTFAYHPGAIQTKLSLTTIAPQTRRHFIDTPELAAGFALWLATSGEQVDFLRGKFVNGNWDAEELLAKKDEIEALDLLWTRVVGQEQVMKK
jgi:NAD(P)-dependent dehydrogenase (short-subunit alcohol dehydrogenase family)